MAVAPPGAKHEGNRLQCQSSYGYQSRIRPVSNCALCHPWGAVTANIRSCPAWCLSLVDEQGKPQDGFLRLHDIYNLNLPTDLVVLSACNTGLGKDVRGEGLVGIVRGFMYAGAARVVASLWKVDDEATAELMKRFYRHMLQTICQQQPLSGLLRWRCGNRSSGTHLITGLRLCCKGNGSEALSRQRAGRRPAAADPGNSELPHSALVSLSIMPALLSSLGLYQGRDLNYSDFAK